MECDARSFRYKEKAIEEEVMKRALKMRYFYIYKLFCRNECSVDITITGHHQLHHNQKYEKMECGEKQPKYSNKKPIKWVFYFVKLLYGVLLV